MERTILMILVDKRKEAAVTAQKILTEWGCLIKTRLGLHDGVLDNCSNSGLIICELVGEKAKKEELNRKLNLLDGVTAKLTELNLKG
ncbi:MAG: hypothetical protein JW938_00510 [Candidatus Omnitrophica bacterium]|nr:hypothetical protein [Candidatus Omnitrophota bacterium]